MHSTAIILAALSTAALATPGRRQDTAASAPETIALGTTWSDDCLAAEASFVGELEAIATSSVAPALQSYLATVVSSGVTNYCEPTNAPAVVSAEWHSEVASIDAIINVYSADIAQVQSCLSSYQTAAGTPYELAAAASAIFSTISSLQACTVTSAAATLPSETGVASGGSNNNGTAAAGSTANGTAVTASATGLGTAASTTATGAASTGAATSSAVAAGAGRVGGKGAGLVGGLLGGLGFAVVMM